MFNGTVNLLTDVTAAAVTSTAAWSGSYSGNKSFQAILTGTGTISCTITISVSNDNSNYITQGVIYLDSTTSPVSDGYATEDVWAYWKATVTSISGTGAKVTLIMGY